MGSGHHSEKSIQYYIIVLSYFGLIDVMEDAEVKLKYSISKIFFVGR